MRLLEVEGLEVSYGAVRALRGVDLYVDSGEIVGLVGANGAGKSTLLRAISGLVRARNGSVRLAGTELGRAATTRIVAVGIAHVPEGRRVWPDMSVAENLRLGGVIAGKHSETERLERALTLFPELRDRLTQK